MRRVLCAYLWEAVVALFTTFAVMVLAFGAVMSRQIWRQGDRWAAALIGTLVIIHAVWALRLKVEQSR